MLQPCSRNFALILVLMGPSAFADPPHFPTADQDQPPQSTTSKSVGGTQQKIGESKIAPTELPEIEYKTLPVGGFPLNSLLLVAQSAADPMPKITRREDGVFVLSFDDASLGLYELNLPGSFNITPRPTTQNPNPVPVAFTNGSMVVKTELGLDGTKEGRRRPVKVWIEDRSSYYAGEEDRAVRSIPYVFFDLTLKPGRVRNGAQEFGCTARVLFEDGQLRLGRSRFPTTATSCKYRPPTDREAGMLPIPYVPFEDLPQSIKRNPFAIQPAYPVDTTEIGDLPRAAPAI